MHTPRPSALCSSTSPTSSCPATRSSIGSTSSSTATATAAAMHTPRPSALRSSTSSTSSCPATRSYFGSTSSSTAAAARNSTSNAAKVVPKCLVYDDDTEEDDLAPLLELPDPDVVSGDTSSTSIVSAAADDALTASADSCVTEVPARADPATDTVAALSLAVAELRGAVGLSPRSKLVLAALAEAAALELDPTAAAANAARRARLRRAGFWGKVRVVVLSATLAAVVTADMALAAYLYARRANERYVHALPPPT